MKQKLSLALVLLVMTCLFAGGKTRRQQQFEVKDADGNIFVLQKDIQTVFDLLGEPLKKENLWAIYPKAGCGFYKIDYENISFLYYDNDNKIVRIVIENDACKIVDNDITVGSSYEEIINGTACLSARRLISTRIIPGMKCNFYIRLRGRSFHTLYMEMNTIPILLSTSMQKRKSVMNFL